VASFASWFSTLGEFGARYRVPLAAFALAVAIVLIVALAVPVGSSDDRATIGRDRALNRAPVTMAEPENLSAFVASRRWGVVLREIIDEQAAAAEAATRAREDIEITQELAEIGFLGLMVEPREYAVLLILRDGEISRFVGGDTLPDGRTLVSVTGNSLTLEGDDGQQDVLPLFPRVRME